MRCDSKSHFTSFQYPSCLCHINLNIYMCSCKCTWKPTASTFTNRYFVFVLPKLWYFSSGIRWTNFNNVWNVNAKNGSKGISVWKNVIAIFWHWAIVNQVEKVGNIKKKKKSSNIHYCLATKLSLTKNKEWKTKHKRLLVKMLGKKGLETK